MPYKDKNSTRAKESAKKRLAKYRNTNRDKINLKAREKTKNDPEYRQKMIDKQKKYIKENREKVLLQKRKNSLKKLYGLSWETYQTILKAQKGVCAICNKKNYSNRRLAVDHDHKTGKIRALLCDKCNLGMGSFNDDKKLLMKVIKYLRKHE